MKQETIVQTLVNLGLTVLQAKVYATLASSGTSTAKTASKAAKVASQDVYRILGELQEKSLVEKIIDKPTKYKAMPIKEGLSILLQNRKKENLRIEKQTKEIANNFHENGNQNNLSENMLFTIFYTYALLHKVHEKSSDMAKISIDIVAPFKMCAFILQPWIKRAIKRGIKIRVMAKKVNEESMLRNSKSLSKNLPFELRYLPENSISFGMHIFDKQEMTISLCDGNALPGLRTNNVHAIQLAGVYFESLWNKAQIN